ncbi:hypothetical protein RJ639_022423, partial [Escallonia herrerae]
MKMMEDCSNRGKSMISGFLAGTADPVCTGPFDVVKTRLMAQSRFGDELKGRVACLVEGTPPQTHEDPTWPGHHVGVADQ